MITLYGIHSPNVWRVRANLLLKGLPFEHVSVDLQNRSEEFISKSPIGKIPFLEDEDGTVVCDSLFIAEYLDRKYPDTYQVFPGDLQERIKTYTAVALLERIQQCATTVMMLDGGYFDNYWPALARAGFIRPSDEELEHLCADATYRLERAHTLLGNGGYFADNRITQADIILFALLKGVLQRGEKIDTSSWEPWLETMMQHDAIANMIAPKEEQGVRSI